MDTNNNEKTNTQETVNMEYQGMIYVITKEEFENLKEGYTTFKEMFG